MFPVSLYQKADEIIDSKGQLNDSTFEKLAKKLIIQYFYFENRESIKKWFSIFGIENILSNISKKENKNFYCSILKCDINSPCHLSKCLCNINNPFYLNCIQKYMKDNELSSLNEKEISFLCNIDIDFIQEKINDCIRKMQLSEIKEDNKELGIFHYLKSDDVCCVCESLIDEKYKIFKYNDYTLAYCSSECFYKKEINEIILEIKYGLDIQYILNWFHDKFRYINRISDILNLSVEEIEKLFDKYGIAKNYLPNSKEVFINRHTFSIPYNIKNILCNMSTQDKKIIDIFGRPDTYLNFENLDEELDNICSYGL